MTAAASTEPVNDYVRRLPALRLRPYVGEYVGYRIAGGPPGTHTGMPSRTMTFIVQFDDPLDLAAMPDPAEPGGRFWAMVGGLHASPALIRHDGSQHGIQLDLTPVGARALLGVPAAALSHLVVPLGTVFARADELVDRLACTSRWPDRFAIVDEVLSAALIDPPPAAAEVDRAWSLLCRHRGAVSVADLARDTGWSRRHLTDRFRCEFGLTPKVAARVLRFEASHDLLRSITPPGLADVAAHCGYADQAHLTREWRSIAGTTPAAWMADEDYLREGAEFELEA